MKQSNLSSSQSPMQSSTIPDSIKLSKLKMAMLKRVLNKLIMYWMELSLLEVKNNFILRHKDLELFQWITAAKLMLSVRPNGNPSFKKISLSSLVSPKTKSMLERSVLVVALEEKKLVVMWEQHVALLPRLSSIDQSELHLKEMKI